MSETGPDTNMRRLKRIQTPSGSAFTLETQREQAKNILLCNFCAFKRPALDYDACEIFAGLERMQARGALPMIRVCKSYQPVLPFRPKLVGLSGEFNTFRLGKAWSERLAPYDIVGLVNAKTGAVFGKARVMQVIYGDLNAMIDQHAYTNHMFLGMEPGDAATKMRALLLRAYGKLVANNATAATVIYLRNLKHAESPPG